MKKKVFALFLAMTMLFSLAACGGSENDGDNTPADNPDAAADSTNTDPFADGPTYTLKFGHVQTTTHPYHLGALAFKEKVEELSKGKITVDIYPNSQLGGEIDMIESMQLGNVDLAAVGTCNLANFDPSYTLFDLPFLFESREHAIAVCESDYGLEKMNNLEQYGLIGLGYFDNGFFDVMNAKVEVTKPSDLKGLNIRIVQNPVYVAAFTALGANPVPMAPAEVYTALQNGTVDGNCLSINGIYNFGWYELQSTYMIANMFFNNLILAMSKSVFDSMPAAYQDAIREAGTYACQQEHILGEEQEATNLEAMVESGITVTEPANIDEWVTLMEEEVYPQFSDVCPADEIELIKSMA